MSHLKNEAGRVIDRVAFDMGYEFLKSKHKQAIMLFLHNQVIFIL